MMDVLPKAIIHHMFTHAISKTSSARPQAVGATVSAADEIVRSEHVIETESHIGAVRDLMFDVSARLTGRAIVHDQSKLEEPERSILQAYPRKGGPDYGTPEYYERLELIRPAIDHHYELNSHHPEHHEDGIRGMSLLDVVEMLCDWMAVNGENDRVSIHESIEHSQKRFGFGDELKALMVNTVGELVA